MKLSIIIVNYNVRFFLEQAIRSALKAIDQIDSEIIVVDNASNDGSKEMMAEVFPSIKYHFLEENLGFSKANNVGIVESKGEYIVLLNPDTVVAENAFSKAISFMDSHPDAGGLGVHMIDGFGSFLPESKRGLPTPTAAFHKIFGLSGLFPNSKRFGKYHLGYLDENQIHEVEILSGAFMLMRKKALDKAGLLDETFFMYGEDIDLSYRLIKAGYKNYYFPESRIIHYKGESTKKGSINYVFVFYRAMLIFAKKHFEKGQASLFGILINSAIYFRAFLALMSRLFGRIWQLLVDGLLSFGIFMSTTTWYGEVAHKNFDLPFVTSSLLAYVIVVEVVLLYSNVYDRDFRFGRLFRGWLFAFLALLAVYALLPEEYRFSRAVLLIGSSISLMAGLVWRILLSSINGNVFEIRKNHFNRTLIIGDEDSLSEINEFLKDHNIAPTFSAGLMNEEQKHYPIGFIGHYDQSVAAINDFEIDEIIFDTRVITNSKMIELMTQLAPLKIHFRMAVGNPLFILGSQESIGAGDKLSSGELNSVNIQSILRFKRTTDVLIAFLVIPVLPILLSIVDEKIGLLRNLKNVLLNRCSWAGYDPRGAHRALPKLKPAVTFSMMNIILHENSEEQVLKENVKYLKRFSPLTDISIFLKHIHSIGNIPK